jgi:hypothetical protein
MADEAHERVAAEKGRSYRHPGHYGIVVVKGVENRIVHLETMAGGCSMNREAFEKAATLVEPHPFDQPSGAPAASDLDVFKAMLERAGVNAQEAPVFHEPEGRVSVGLHAPPNQDGDGWVMFRFDARGALKRVDGGA